MAVARCVGLLRGVNVGGRNALAMAELRSLFESLGHRDVTTFIQSGNILFTPAAPVTAGELEAAIRGRFGLEVSVMLRTGRQLRRVLGTNPFPSAEPSALHVGFLAEKPQPAAVRALDPGRYEPEAYVLRGTELYLHLPAGMGRAKLPAYLGKAVGVPTTYRNWATVEKLADLAG